MDIQQLRNFQTIALDGRLTRAAQILHISEPALSLSLGRLEHDLGVKLFNRTGRNIILNEYGNIFLKYVNEILQIMKNAQSEIDRLVEHKSSKITICWNYTGVLEKLLLQYIDTHPDITVDNYYVPEYQISDELNNPDCDFAIIGTGNPGNYPFEKIVFLDQEWYLAIPSDHPLAIGPNPRLAQFSEEQFSVSAIVAPHEEMTRRFCKNAGFDCKIAYAVTPTVGLDLVIEKRCLTFVSAGLAKMGAACDMYADKITFIPLAKDECICYTLLMWNKRKKCSRSAQGFLDYLRACTPDTDVPLLRVDN